MSNYPKTRKEQEVWQACDDLIAKGCTVKEVTGEAIAVRLRELKYKVGSTTQRYQYRDSWMAARGFSREEQGRSVTDISDPIARAATVFREGLERELKSEYDKRYQQLEASLVGKEVLLQEKEAQVQSLQVKLTESTHAHEQLQARYQVQSEKWQKLNEESISQKTVIHQQQQQAENEKVLYETQLGQLRQLFETEREENKRQLVELEKTYQAHISDIKESAEKQRHHLIVELDEAKMAVKRLKQEQQKGQDAYLILHQQYNQLQGQHKQLQVMGDELKEEQVSERKQDKAIREEHSYLLENIATHQEKTEAALLSLSGLPKVIAHLQKELSHLLIKGLAINE